MKNLVIFTNESLVGGMIRTGLSELTDSLANSVAVDIATSVVCIDNNGKLLQLASSLEQCNGYRKCRLLNVDYYLIPQGDDWVQHAASVIDDIKPDVLHCFVEPQVLSMMSHHPERTVYTIEQGDPVRDKTEYLAMFDIITTVSKEYKRELLTGTDELQRLLTKSDFRALPVGIVTSVLNPIAGLRLPAAYSAENQGGKIMCKRKLLETYGIYGNPAIYLMACRFVECKGVEEVLSCIHQIRDSGGFTLFVGRGDRVYEDQLRKLTRDDGALWINKMANMAQVLPLLAGSDFFLCPSRHETGGLMPLKACRYGAIPIATRNGGLADNLNKDIAVIIGSDGLSGAIDKASAMYKNKFELFAKRTACMSYDFSWDTRKQGYLEAYGI